MAFFSLLLILYLLSDNAYIISCENDFYSSTLSTEDLIEVHGQLVRTFKGYLEATTEATDLLKRFLSESDLSSISQPWPTFGDPLRTYHLVKRTSKEIDGIVAAIRKMRSLDPLLEIGNLRESGSLPTMEDYEGVTMSIIRLQELYLIPPEELVQGRIKDGIQSPVQLTASDCLFIGKKSKDDAMMWYQAGLNVSDENDSQVRLDLEHELVLLENQTKIMDVLEKLKNELEKQTEEEYTSLPEEYDVDITEEALKNETNDWDVVMRNYRKLCRGENIRSPSLDAKCSCYLKQGPHPYLKLRPLKIEVRNRDPFMGVLHDILGDKLIQTIKDKSMPAMTPSTVVGPEALSIKSELRVSSTSWLGDYHLPTLQVHLETLTGLFASVYKREAEDLQVLNYGAGGHYIVHHDFFEDDRADNFSLASGGRLATLMVYLSDVEAGGATVFPRMGVTVLPEKGSAAFWWNLKHSVTGDYRTLHAGCPVIYGTKWVCNKWFRAYPQMFRFPCGPRIDSGPNIL